MNWIEALILGLVQGPVGFLYAGNGDLTTFEAIVIAIVEGLTEFLPVSSTGHMIIAQNVLGVESTEFVKAFTFIIQFGAILSVVVLYWKRFFRLNHEPLPKGVSGFRR